MHMTERQNCPAGRIARLRKLMQERGYDAVVVRDESNLRWLTGAAGVFDFSHEYPHAAIVTHNELLLHTDSRYFNSFVERMGQGEPWAIDMESIAIPRWVAERLAKRRCRVVAIEDDMQLSFYEKLLRAFDDVSCAVLLPRLHGDIQALRAVKDAEEISCMRAAQAVTDAGFAHMKEFIRPGLTEKEIRAELEHFMLAHGGEGLAFSTIVASGPNTANPHAVPSDRTVRQGDFVLMDYGARVSDYCSDMTRTVVVGEPSAQQREIYDIVRSAHEACAAAAHAGVIGSEIHNLAVKIISDAGYGDYFKHGLGHGVGIDIHEQPSFGRLWDKPVPTGAVVTIEPGIYLPGVGGVRLEDYGVVTEGGFEPFTRSEHDLVIL